LADIASRRQLDQRGIYNCITKLDNKTPIDRHFALTLTRIEPDGTARFINEGENKIYIRQSTQLQDISDISHGKVGYLQISPLWQTAPVESICHTVHLSKQDRIFLCTDGVFDYEDENAEREATIHEIQNIVFCAQTPAEVIQTINENTVRRLRRHGASHPLDDYTMICMELKQNI
jgi:serine/threonine protein phosphatase PrpC